MKKKLTFHAPIKLEQLRYIKDSDSVNIVFEGKAYKGLVSEKRVFQAQGSLIFIVEKKLTLSKDHKINFSIPILKKSYLDLLIENKDSFL